MNSIAELNTKWWYRLIKVIYILFFLITATMTVIEVLVIGELTGNEASFIQCPNGTVLGLAEIGLRFGEDKPADFDEFIRQLKVARLEGKLGDTPEDQYRMTIKLLRREFPQYHEYIALLTISKKMDIRSVHKESRLRAACL